MQLFATCGVQALAAIFGEGFYQFPDGACLLGVVAVVAVEHLLEGPLRPVVVFGVAGAYFAVPVEGETYLVKLFAVAVDVVDGGNRRVLSRLDGVLLGGQSVSVISHGVQYVETLQSFVAGVNVRSDVTQRVSYVQSRAGGVGEHVQHIEFLLRLVFRHLVGLVLHPPFLPFLFNLPEIVFHTAIC